MKKPAGVLLSVIIIAILSMLLAGAASADLQSPAASPEASPGVQDNSITFELPNLRSYRDDGTVKIVLDLEYDDENSTWTVKEDDGPAISVAGKDYVITRESSPVFWGAIVLMIAVLLSIGLNCFLIITRKR